MELSDEEQPPLPEPAFTVLIKTGIADVGEYFIADDMREYARAILAAQAAKKQPGTFHLTQPAGEAATTLPIPLGAIRKWPVGFAARWAHVTNDLQGFTVDYWLYDLSRTLAEIGYRMEVYAPGSQADNASPMSDHPLRICGAAGEVGDADIRTDPVATIKESSIVAQEGVDAARYRHVREHAYIELDCDSPRVDGWTPERLDAAVDARIWRNAGEALPELLAQVTDENRHGEAWPDGVRADDALVNRKASDETRNEGKKP